MARALGIALIVFSLTYAGTKHYGSSARPGSRSARLDAKVARVPTAVFVVGVVIGTGLLAVAAL